MAASTDTAEYDWLFDYVQSVFQAPTWELPIGSFIDENCIVFDNEDENKLAYTEVHQKFCKLVDEILEQHLMEIGLSAEEFVKICAAAKDSRDLNKAVFEKLVAMEDFREFKAMMTRRNTELELEAMAAVSGTPAAEAPAPAPAPTPAPAPAPAAPSAPSSADEGGAGAAPSGAEDMEAALAASAAEFERAKRLADMELAEVEAAIAASLALERERLEKLKALAAKEAAAAAAAASAAEGKEAEGGGKAQEEVDAPEPDVATRMLLEAPDATSAATAAHAQRGVKPEEAPSTGTATAPSPAPAPAAAEGKSEDKPYDPFADTPDMGGFGSAGTGGSLPPLRPTASMGLAKLPDILKGAHANVVASEEGLAAVKKERAALRASAEADAASLDAATQAKLAERAAHLRRQRDLILAKRKAEREEKLAQFKASGKPGVDAGTKSRVAAAVASMPSGEDAAPPTSLTASLAEKVRSDYLTSEERRKLAAKQASHVSLQERLASAKQAQERTAAAQAKAMQSLRQVAASRAAAVMSTSPGR